MSRTRSYLLAIVIALPLLFATLLVVLSFTVKPSDVEQTLGRQIEWVAGSRLTFDRLEYHALPWPSATMTNVRLTDGKKPERALSVDRAKIQLQIIPLIFGKAAIQGFSLQDGELVCPLPAGAPLEKIEIGRLNVRTNSLMLSRRISVDFQGDLFGVSRSFEGKLSFDLDSAETLDGFPPVFSLIAKFRQFPLGDLKGHLRTDFQIQPQSGSVSGKIVVEKIKGSDDVTWKTDLNIQKLIYQLPQDLNGQTSQPIDAVWQSDVQWNIRNGEVNVKKSVLTSPVGKFEVGGRVNSDSGEMQNMRVSIGELSLERLPNYILNAKDAIPFNLGFSGQSNVEMALSGTWDHLSLHGNWDLSPTLLTYGGYFSKSKDVPLNISFDFLVKKGKLLSGDFTAKLEKAKAKGTIKGADFESGKAQINIITNKFSIAGWETFLPPLRDYAMDGVVKLMVNFAGNMKKAGEMQPTVNATIENVKLIHRQKGTGIQNAFGLVDYGSVALKLRQIHFEIKNSPVEMSAIIYNQLGIPIVKGKLSSPQLAPFDLAASLEDFASVSLPPSWGAKMKASGDRVRTFFPEEEPIKNLAVEYTCKKNQCQIPRFEFEAYDGWINQTGTIDFSVAPATYVFNCELNHLNLGRLSAVLWKDKRVVDGNLFSKTSFSGSGFGSAFDVRRLKGEGTLSITKGNWHTLNLLGSLAKTEELKALAPFVSPAGATAFTDLRASLVLQDGKIKSDNLAMLAKDLSLKINGEAAFDGTMNGRGEVYLSQDPAVKVLTALFPGYQSAGPNQQLGPIPVLLAGHMDKPEIQIDPALWPAFKDRLLKEGSREVLTNFLPEDFFFGEAKKS